MFLEIRQSGIWKAAAVAVAALTRWYGGNKSTGFNRPVESHCGKNMVYIVSFDHIGNNTSPSAVRNVLRYLAPAARHDFPVLHDVGVLARGAAELGRLPVVVHHILQEENQ